MPTFLLVLIVAAIVGGGLVSGLLFAFSVAVMPALRDLSPQAGMQAMQRINVVIINPIFLFVFLGTSLLCIAVAFFAMRGLPSASSICLLIGALAYLIGPLGITMAFNVPLNNQLAAVPADRAQIEWPKYVSAWLRWNHMRTALGAVAIALLSTGLVQAA
jgi:uncharacterized membrane protein